MSHHHTSNTYVLGGRCWSRPVCGWEMLVKTCVQGGQCAAWQQKGNRSTGRASKEISASGCHTKMALFQQHCPEPQHAAATVMPLPPTTWMLEVTRSRGDAPVIHEGHMSNSSLVLETSRDLAPHTPALAVCHKEVASALWPSQHLGTPLQTDIALQ